MSRISRRKGPHRRNKPYGDTEKRSCTKASHSALIPHHPSASIGLIMSTGAHRTDVRQSSWLRHERYSSMYVPSLIQWPSLRVSSLHPWHSARTYSYERQLIIHTSPKGGSGGKKAHLHRHHTNLHLGFLQIKYRASPCADRYRSAVLSVPKRLAVAHIRPIRVHSVHHWTETELLHMSLLLSAQILRGLLPHFFRKSRYNGRQGMRPAFSACLFL